MPKRRHLASLTLLACLAVAGESVLAQSPGPVQIVVGWVGSPNAANHGVTFGVGVPVTKTVSLEVGVTWPSGVSETWLDTDLNPPDPRVLSVQRDVPFVLAARYRVGCTGRWCAELMAGGGVSFHREVRTLLDECNISGCTPLSPRPTGSVQTTNELTGVMGAGLEFSASRRVDVVPMVRLFLIAKPGCDTKGRACSIGPEQLPSERFEAVISLRIRLK